MSAVVAEFESGDKLRMSEHGGHALSGQVIVDGQGLVGARGGRIHSASIERDLDQGSVLSGRAFEGSGMFSVGHGVHADVPVLTGGKDVLVVGLKKKLQKLL
jgi:hypothetical protein